MHPTKRVCSTCFILTRTLYGKKIPECHPYKEYSKWNMFNCWYIILWATKNKTHLISIGVHIISYHYYFNLGFSYMHILGIPIIPTWVWFIYVSISPWSFLVLLITQSLWPDYHFMSLSSSGVTILTQEWVLYHLVKEYE